MSEPMPEAYEAAGQAYDAQLDEEGWSPPVGTFLQVNRAGLAAVVDAVWPLADERGYRRAIEALRDEAAWADYMLSRGDDDLYDAENRFAADYLESLAAPRNEGAQT